MADPKTKAVNGNINGNTNTNGNHVPDKEAKQSKLWQLLALAKEVSKDVETIQDYEKASEEKKAKEQQLEAKQGEVQRLREFNDKIVREFSEYKAQASTKTETLFGEFEQKFKTYDSNKAAVEAMEKETKELKEKLAAAEVVEKKREDEVGKLKGKIQTADTQAKSQAGEIREMAAECEIHRSKMQVGIVELEACRVKLAEAREDLGDGLFRDYGPDGLRKLGLDLKALSKKCHSLVLEYFNDQDGAKDSAPEIQELKTRFPQIPLSTSSTKPAAHLRCAAAEAVISSILTTQIFIPFYLPNGTKALATSLLDIFADNEKQRTIYRCQVLRSIRGGAEEVARIEEDIVRKASNEIRTTLHPLVGVSKQGAFYNAVPMLVKEALELWRGVQRSRELITAEGPDVNEVQLPGRFEEYDYAAVTVKGGKGEKGKGMGAKSLEGASLDKLEIAAALFPQVVSREDLIFNGMALWSDQAIAMKPAAAVVLDVAGAGNVKVGLNGVNIEAGKQGGARTRRKSVVALDSPFKARQGVNES